MPHLILNSLWLGNFYCSAIHQIDLKQFSSRALVIVAWNRRWAMLPSIALGSWDGINLFNVPLWGLFAYSTNYNILSCVISPSEYCFASSISHYMRAYMQDASNNKMLLARINAVQPIRQFQFRFIIICASCTLGGVSFSVKR